ncbi:hypothetical protein LJB77_01485 [Ruminococcaceae bacterium OttesenSCG-928-N02]|nr:hypothetical protein [Ruminococcaceae bacterium OttesenSCG-928-N02]
MNKNETTTPAAQKPRDADNNPSLSDAQIDAAASAFGDTLAQQKKVRIKIPKDPINPADSFVPVCVNGYIYQINRGESVDVPQTVAELLEEGKYI